MKKLIVVSAICLLCACRVTETKAEGFSLTQWSARGLALAGGMVGRADDPSAIAYNAAGITFLSGTHVMGGFTGVDPKGTINLNEGNGTHTSTTNKSHVLSAPYAYISHQLNERFWLGFGLFSRFGLNHEFPGDWSGRYDLTNIKLQTFSFVPTVAMKANDALSLSFGLEIMHAGFTMGRQIPCLQITGQAEDIKMTLDATNWGIGVHLGAHLRMTDKLSLGFAYKSSVRLNISGTADFSRYDENLLAEMGEVPHAIATNMHSKIRLPESFAVGLAYRPTDNLSFEIGTVFTRWSTYDSLNIQLDSDFQSVSKKKWRDGWNFNASVEYEPVNWLALRAGIWHETAVTNEAHADFVVPSHGRTGVSLGTGLRWKNWKLDVSYAHVRMRGLDYSDSDALSSSSIGDILSGNSRNLSANVYSAAIAFTF